MEIDPPDHDREINTIYLQWTLNFIILLTAVVLIIVLIKKVI